MKPDFFIFTKTCRRDMERFEYLCATRRKFLPEADHYVVLEGSEAHGYTFALLDDSRTYILGDELYGAESASFYRENAYLWQQYMKLVSFDRAVAPVAMLDYLLSFHIDSDMWFDGVLDLHQLKGLWVYTRQGFLPAHRQRALEKQFRTIGWLLGFHRYPKYTGELITAMDNTRGWWIRQDVLDALLRRIRYVHGKHLWELLPELVHADFREYELYANFAWAFWRDAHHWEPTTNADALACSPEDGRDRPFFVRHSSSTSELTAEMKEHQRKLLEDV